MMPAYNAERFIGQAIESVLAQSYPAWELLIVNDGSKDGTAEVISRYRDPRICVVNQENGGEAAARNTALENVRGEYLAFLDSDDLFRERHLEGLVNFLDNHADCEGVYTDGFYCDQDGKPIQTLSSRRRGPFEGDIFAEVARSSDVFGPPVCVMLRSQAIFSRRLSFDTEIVIGPDWDFFTRFAEAGRFGYLEADTCLYRLHGTNITFQTDLERRALYLARCREKAIKLKRFGECPEEIRWFVFYDLLVNLLNRHPERQAGILQWPEFRCLRDERQAHLLRLMVSKAISQGQKHSNIREWLQKSGELDPGDRHGRLLSAAYRFNPALCRSLLRARDLTKTKGRRNSLFGKIDQN
jgi:glycosyltransferase involved in cell wall biosynthesis